MARRNRRGGVLEADLDDVYRREEFAGLHQRLDALAEAVEMLLQQRLAIPVCRGETENNDNPLKPFADAPRPTRPTADRLENDTHRESAFRIEILEVHGNVNVEEVMDFKTDYDESEYGESVYNESEYDESEYNESVYGEDELDKVTYDHPIYDEHNEAIYDETVNNVPLYEKTVFPEAIYDDAIYDEPVYIEVKYDEVALDELVLMPSKATKASAPNDSIGAKFALIVALINHSASSGTTRKNGERKRNFEDLVKWLWECILRQVILRRRLWRRHKRGDGGESRCKSAIIPKPTLVKIRGRIFSIPRRMMACMESMV